jgi:hypothetical protein
LEVCRRWRLGERQEHPERCAHANRRLDLDPAVVLINDAMDRRQVQASALTQLFGGEEPLENPLQRSLIHAMTGVDHGEAGEVAGPRLEVVADIPGLQAQPVRAQFEPPAPGHRLASVEAQVHYHLFQHACVGLYPDRLRGWVEDHVNVLARQPPQHPRQALDHLVEI